ncbi:MAG: CRISPR-associated endonuclease Cas1 [Nitrospirae bacterium]|nr:MAG: CRISPR-associated endonuclease Cas1 [Nitrospirota bacterium]
MAVVYITEQGSYLTKKGERLIITKQDKVIQQIHAFKLEQIVIIGNVMLSPATIAFLLKKGIDTVFMSIYGKYRGRLISGFGKNIELRRIQFKKMDEEDDKLSLAKHYVHGKLSNCRTLLRRHNLTYRDSNVTTALHKMHVLLRKINRVDTLMTLMGIEGQAAAIYFGIFGRLIKVRDITFDGRNRRPPLDPVNVLLSLGYTLLENVIQTQVNIVGLDPYLGCLHSVENGRPSLVLDLMEEFRPVLVDSLVLQLINKRIIRLTDFYRPEEQEPAAFDFAETESTRDDLPILLTHVGMKKFIIHFENRINQKVFYENTAMRLSYRDICLEQVRLLVRHLRGEAEYKPFIMR